MLNIQSYDRLFTYYKIAAIDVYCESEVVYLCEADEVVGELTKVVQVNIKTGESHNSQYIGSYTAHRGPLRRVDPQKDNIELLQNTILKFRQIDKLNLLKALNGEDDMQDEGYAQYYNLESYLIEVVRPRFHREGKLSTHDFFCIIIWKSNRAKSLTAKRLLKQFANLHQAVEVISQTMANQNISHFQRFEYLIGLGLRLPMVSAILTVLYPDDFTVFDFRVCSFPKLNSFAKLDQVKSVKMMWEGYQDYISIVVANTPKWMSLRSKDHYLWGRSFFKQLDNDVLNNFGVVEGWIK